MYGRHACSNACSRDRVNMCRRTSYRGPSFDAFDEAPSHPSRDAPFPIDVWAAACLSSIIDGRFKAGRFSRHASGFRTLSLHGRCADDNWVKRSGAMILHFRSAMLKCGQEKCRNGRKHHMTQGKQWLTSTRYYEESQPLSLFSYLSDRKT